MRGRVMISILIIAMTAKGQGNTELLLGDTVHTEPNTVEEFIIVDSMPQYPGGEQALMEYMIKHIQYPEEAKREGVEGNVWIQFVIDKKGAVTDAKVMRSIGYGCDEEALRVVNAMPDWIPGYADGKPARVLFNLPVKFKLLRSGDSDVDGN